MKRKVACTLLLNLIAVPLWAEISAPQIAPSAEAPQAKAAEVPPALQHPHPEALSADNLNRAPTSTVQESYRSPISHSLEVPNLEEYKEAFQVGDKTSAPIQENEANKQAE